MCGTRGGLHVRPERDNRLREQTLNMQKSAEVIVAQTRRAESIGVLITTWEGGKNEMDAENNKESCSQRDSAEHKGYVRAHRSFNRIWKERDSAEPELLEKILERDNLNRAFKRVKANKGAAGIDGMTVEEAFSYFKENKAELISRILRGKYTPSPVRRVEIPKPDGGIRKLGIPTVIDRTIQQAIAQKLMPIYEPLFSEGSYGYRPGRSAKDAILKVKEYAEQGYTYAVALDLSKYFDTINHEILLNILRRNIKDERVVQMIKRYLKSGVMENGVVTETEEGSPQGGLCRARHNPPYAVLDIMPRQICFSFVFQ